MTPQPLPIRRLKQLSDVDSSAVAAGKAPVWDAQPGALVFRDPDSLFVTLPPYNAKGDGSTDDTAALQAALDQAEANAAAGRSAHVVLGTASYMTTGLSIATGVTLEGQGEKTFLKLIAGSNANLIQSKSFGSATTWDNGIRLKSLFLIGNQALQSATLHPQTYVTSDASISASSSTVSVADTSSFPSSGTVWLGWAPCSYTGKTSTSFTGLTSASTGTIRQGAWVTPVTSKGHGLALQAARSLVRDVWVRDCAGSGIFFQGAAPAAGYAYENRVEGVTRVDRCGRFGLEVGENSSDSHIKHIVLGENNLMGAMLVRSADWVADSIHLVGTYGTMPLVPQGLLIAGNDFRADKVYLDTFPGTGVVFDSGLRGGLRLTDCSIGKLRGFHISHGAGGGGHGVLFRGPGVNGSIQRITIDEANLWAPVGYGFQNGPSVRTVGTQNLTALPGGKLQVVSALDFAPSSAIGGQIRVSTDTLSYTGRQMTQALTTVAAAVGDTTLNVDDASGFDSAGTVTLLALSSAGSYTAMTITYTGKTATTLTGIPGSSTGSITTATPAGCGVAQHFFTGVTGGALTSVGVVLCFSSALTAQVLGLQVANPTFQSFQIGRFNMAATDDWYITGGSSGGKKMRGIGGLSIAAGASTASTAHGLAEVPTRKTVTPTTDTQGRRWWATADATNITVTLDSTATTNPIAFDWAAELV